MSHTLENIPQHVAIIMDGNGRWAQGSGRERLFGHHNGVESVRQVVETAGHLGVKYLTLYAFSTENWGRPDDEVDGLMELISYNIVAEVENLRSNGIKFRFIGDLDALPQSLRQSIALAHATEVEPQRMTLVLALNYSSRWEITKAMQQIVSEGLSPHDITEQTISEHLQTSFMPDPDLLIRTSGEQRLSNFLLWQLSYSELYFTPVLWPEFGREELLKAIEQYGRRERRFGLTAAQIK